MNRFSPNPPEREYEDVFDASCRGNLAAVRQFSDGFGIYARNAENQTVAHVSAQCGHLEIVKLCFQRDEAFFARALDVSGNTVIHAAAIGGSLNIVHYLSLKSDPLWRARQNLYGDTTLHLAARYGNLEVVEFLFIIEEGKQYNKRNTFEETPALVAAKYNHYPVLSYLLRAHRPYIQDSDSRDYHLLHWTAQNGNACAIFEICAVYQVQSRQLSTVTGQYPIHLAVAYGHMEATKTLIECGADPMINQATYPWYTSSHIAAAWGLMDMLKLLHDLGFKNYEVKNEELGQTPILVATMRSQLDVVKYLVENGADASVRDAQGNTILHYAAKHENVSIPKYLLDERGIYLHLNATNSLGQTCVYVATQYDNLDFLQYMMGQCHRYLLNVPASNGRTPLMEAIIGSKRRMINYLMQDWKAVSRASDPPHRFDSKKVKSIPSFVSPTEIRSMAEFDPPPSTTSRSPLPLVSGKVGQPGHSGRLSRDFSSEGNPILDHVKADGLRVGVVLATLSQKPRTDSE